MNSVRHMLFKVAAACNLACRYCYWFQDARVDKLPRTASEAVLSAVLQRIEQYILDERLSSFTVSLHGGEPMLLGYKRLVAFVIALKEVAKRTSANIGVSMQTNAVLMDARWATTLKELDVAVGVSLDGLGALNDVNRVTRAGLPSFDKVARGIDALTAAGHRPSALMVYTPGLNLSALIAVLERFNIMWVDVLVPDATWGEGEQPLIEFFPDLVEFWHSHLRPHGVHVRFASNVFELTGGGSSASEGLGGGACSTFSVESDGGYALLDVLNTWGTGAAATSMSVHDHSFAEFIASEPFRWQRRVSSTLPDDCVGCDFAARCGGGYFPSRWSPATQSFRKSANCRTLYASFARAAQITQIASSNAKMEYGGSKG